MALIKRCACGWINDSNEAICRKCGNDIIFESLVEMPDDEYERIMAEQNGTGASSTSHQSRENLSASDGSREQSSGMNNVRQASGGDSFADLFSGSSGEQKNEQPQNPPPGRSGGKGRIIVKPINQTGNGQSSQQPLFKFCSCGETNSPDRSLCSKCGASLNAVAAMTAEKHRELVNSLNQNRKNPAPQPAAQAAVSGKHLMSLDGMCAVQPAPSGQKSILGRSSSDKNVREYLESRKGVSRNHANIWHDGKNLFIEDLGSTNGTYIDNTRIEPKRAYVLKSGCQVTLGNPRSDSDKIAIFRTK
jgi:hypothetical protein